MPKDSIGIFVFKHRKAYKFPNLKQFSLPKENAQWVAFLSDMKKAKKKQAKDDDAKIKKNDDTSDQKSKLILFHAATGDTICFDNVTEYFYAPLGRNITFIRQTKDSGDRAEVVVFDTATRKSNIAAKRCGVESPLPPNLRPL